MCLLEIRLGVWSSFRVSREREMRTCMQLFQIEVILSAVPVKLNLQIDFRQKQLLTYREESIYCYNQI